MGNQYQQYIDQEPPSKYTNQDSPWGTWQPDPWVTAQQQQQQQQAPPSGLTGLAAQENQLLNRGAPGMAQPMLGGVMQARGNQLGAIQAQQQLMNGPSLAQMQAQQQFGQARAQMGTQGSALAQRAAMTGGNQALGGMAQQTGAAVGKETGQAQTALGSGINALGQSDIQGQNTVQGLIAKQQQMDLTQRNMNLGQAQGLEQNYYNVQNAYTQAAQADQARRQALGQAQGTQTLQEVGAGVKMVGEVAAAA